MGDTGIGGMSGSQGPQGMEWIGASPGGTQEVEIAFFQGQAAKVTPQELAQELATNTAELGDELGLILSAFGNQLKEKEKTNKSLTEGRKAAPKGKGEAENVQEVSEASNQMQTPAQVKQKFKEILPDLSESKLESFLGRLKERTEEEKLAGYTDTKMIADAKDFFGDVSHQYAAIEYARVIIKEELNDPNLSGPDRDRKAKLLSFLDKGSNRLLREEGTNVRAGLNVSALAAAAEKEGLDTLSELRNLYRNKILGHTNIVQTFKDMVKCFGASRISQGTQFILNAASKDLQAEKPSLVERGKMHDIVGDIYRMQTLSGMFGRLDKFLEILEKELNEPPQGS